MMKSIFVFAIFLAVIHHGTAWRSFMRGRSSGGNLGSPFMTKAVDPPEELWFNQYLDHFNPVEGRTWKQV